MILKLTLTPIAIFMVLLLLVYGCATDESKNNSSNLTPIPKLSVKGCYLENYPDPLKSEYILPYEIGASVRISQGNCGTLDTHRPSCTMLRASGARGSCGDRRYAYDFALPIGAKILAARSGKIIRTVGKFSNLTNDSDKTNLVIIKHDDESIGVYLHLSQNGVLVNEGDLVSQGEVIGLSGSSGYTGSTPHLHFDVLVPPFDKCTATIYSGCKTTPVTFKNADPLDAPLIEGKMYKASNF